MVPRFVTTGITRIIRMRARRMGTTDLTGLRMESLSALAPGITADGAGVAGTMAAGTTAGDSITMMAGVADTTGAAAMDVDMTATGTGADITAAGTDMDTWVAAMDT